MKHLQKIFLVLITASLFNACNTTEPPSNQTLTLKLEDVSCIEAWIQLTTNNLQLPTTINILKNNTVAQTFSLSTQDTLLYIDSLLPNQTYKFKVVLTNNPQPTSYPQPPTSNEVSVTTMDTTSHEFTWQTFTFGDAGAGSSTLYDVAIIDENNIWAVGEIYMLDSLGNPDPSLYNLIKWNGTQWKPERVYFKDSQGQSFLAPMKSVFAFNAKDVWIGLDQIIYWNGTTYKSIELPDAVFQSWINKMWGSSSNDLYVVGNKGSIAHYNGSSWTKIESGTDVDLKDIYGNLNNSEIWTCGWNYQTGQSMILKITESNSEIIWDSEMLDPGFVYNGLINSICSNGIGEFVFVGGQVYRQSLLAGRLARREWVKTPNGSKVLELGNYGYRIKGSNKNNIAVVGDASMLWHYNGTTWYKYTELHNEDDRLYGLAVQDNLMVAVGKRYAPGTLGLGLLIIGRR